jgi:hypothetical protein
MTHQAGRRCCKKKQKQCELSAFIVEKKMGFKQRFVYCMLTSIGIQNGNHGHSLCREQVHAQCDVRGARTLNTDVD